jgi:hypothetical protein
MQSFISGVSPFLQRTPAVRACMSSFRKAIHLFCPSTHLGGLPQVRYAQQETEALDCRASRNIRARDRSEPDQYGTYRPGKQVSRDF